MKRVSTLATAGAFSLGLVLLPMMGHAAETATTGGKDGKPVAASTTAAAPAMHGGPAVGTTAGAPVKKDDPKVTAIPSTSTGSTVAPATGTTAKPPVKTGS